MVNKALAITVLGVGLLLGGCGETIDYSLQPEKYELNSDKKAFLNNVDNGVSTNKEGSYKLQLKLLNSKAKKLKNKDERGQLLSEVRVASYDYVPSKKELLRFVDDIKESKNNYQKTRKKLSDKYLLESYFKSQVVQRYYLYEYSLDDKKKDEAWYAGKYAFEYGDLVRDSYLWDKNVVKADKDRIGYINKLDNKFKTNDLKDLTKVEDTKK